MVPNVDATVLRRIPAKTPALRLLRNYIGAIQHAPTTPDLERLAATHVYDLLAITLGATRDAAEVASARGGQAARLHAVTAGIEEHLANPALSAAWLSVKLGLSERYVHHLMAGTGSSFADLVRRKRLERARRMLEQPSATARRIIDVAFAVGFADLSTFNRAFRRQFGCAPSDVQRPC
jgi:AraC-like DNA-binding protein